MSRELEFIGLSQNNKSRAQEYISKLEENPRDNDTRRELGKLYFDHTKRLWVKITLQLWVIQVQKF